MNKGGLRIFKDKKVLEEMVALRIDGWSFPRIARKYGCDHTSVMYRYKQYEKEMAEIANRKAVREGHCPRCDLLLRSEFFCGYCKDLKVKK